ncbi:hypothetical protein [Streptomyces sp. OK228]|uniref:hypothetical protein n=1 Tax=Streptomyces sp. OK228 TaxID=1882786 RepID=UPI000BDAFF01|nr:hypothetical protein [Streptomyces sp. OK228]SOE31822.1 hypothetical protein SAMN05442782_8756 [Streptomyces sp. OK228]
MGHRPRPRADRARHQIERAAHLPACPWCKHPIQAHDVQAGQRVCTRGHEEPSCRDCREIRNNLTGAGLQLWTFARIMSSPPSARPAPLAFGRPVASAAARSVQR